MNDEQARLTPLSLLRLQSWLSPAFPIGAYSYSHALEFAVEAAYVQDRKTLVQWLAADLRYGSGLNEAIFFCEAWRNATVHDRAKLFRTAELAAAYRATQEFALESSQQGSAAMSMLHAVWPDRVLHWLLRSLRDRSVQPALSVVLGVRLARQDIPLDLALPTFLQSYIANQITAAVRVIPLGQTDGQMAVAELEEAVLMASAGAQKASLDDLGSAGVMVDICSMAHETQYTRLFRS